MSKRATNSCGNFCWAHISSTEAAAVGKFDTNKGRARPRVLMMCYLVCNGYWFSHHIDFTSISALIIWLELTEFQWEIISETHPIILANDQSSCRQHSFLLLPHEDICAQIGNLAWQYQTFTNLSTENLVMTQYLRTGLSSFFHKVLGACKRKYVQLLPQKSIESKDWAHFCVYECRLFHIMLKKPR